MKIQGTTSKYRSQHNIFNAWAAISHGYPSIETLPLSKKRLNFNRFRSLYQNLSTQPRNLRRRLSRKARLPIADIAFLLAMGFSLPASANNILVEANLTEIAADGKCSLIEAINNANADTSLHADCANGSGYDVVILDGASNHVITSSVAGIPGQGLPTITSNMHLKGNGATIRVGAVPVDTVINVAEGRFLRLSQATITGDADSGTGGGLYKPRIQNNGTMTLSNVTISLASNAVSGITNRGSMKANNLIVDGDTQRIPYYQRQYEYTGHGILNLGSCTLTNSQIINHYLGYFHPYGALDNKGTMELLNTSVENNYTASYRVERTVENTGALTGRGVSIVDNRSYNGETGVRNHLGASLNLSNSVITGNRGSGRAFTGGFTNHGQAFLQQVSINENTNGIDNTGQLELMEGSISGNGGGFSISNDGMMTLRNVTVADNLSAYFINSITNTNQLTITNSTIASNSSGEYAYSTLSNYGELTISNSTIAGGYYSGGLLSNTGTLSLSHTLLTGFQYNGDSLIPGHLLSNSGLVITSEYNLFGDSSHTTEQAFSGFTPGSTDITATSNGNRPTALSDIIATEAHSLGKILPRLADNGGPNLTVSLVSDSPAINSGAAICEDTDQRGVSRPQGSACDIGAYELDGSVPASCPPFTDFEPRGCTGLVRISTLEELEEYKTSNYGLDSDGLYRNLRVVNGFGDPSTPLTIQSPCNITVTKPVTLRGSQITVEGRRGVLMYWGSKIETGGNACLLTEQSNVHMKGGHKVSAEALTLKAQKLARIGSWSQVTVAGPVVLESLINNTSGRVEIGNDSILMATSLDMRAAYQAFLRARSSVTTTEDAYIEAGNLADSIAGLGYQSTLQTGGNFTLQSGGESRLGPESQTQVNEIMTMNAESSSRCTVASNAEISATETAGNCADKLP